VLDYGGARRTTLRGRENILKRYRLQTACFNLCLVLRHLTGLGTLKQTWAASAAPLAALAALLRTCIGAIGSSVSWSGLQWAGIRTITAFSQTSDERHRMLGTSTVC